MSSLVPGQQFQNTSCYWTLYGAIVTRVTGWGKKRYETKTKKLQRTHFAKFVHKSNDKIYNILLWNIGDIKGGTTYKTNNIKTN